MAKRKLLGFVNLWLFIAACSDLQLADAAQVSCNFDEGLCSGWRQSSSDVFDWTRFSGSTPSSDTGPSSGHGGSGYYMYIETSSPRARGNNAKLELLVPGNKTSSCLTFYYHMFGSSMGTLYVFNGNAIVFTKSGNQGDIWKKVTQTLDFGGAITFEGVTGSSFTSDIAIDDVSVSEGSCPGCGGHLNESTGQLHVSGADLHCNWTIGSAGISQAVALVSIQGLYLLYCREFVKIYDNKGAEIFTQPGCSSFVRQTLLEIPVTNASSVIVEVSLEYRLSFVNIQYDILKHGIDSAQLVPSWNITVTNVSSNSVWLEWSPFPLNLPISKYLVKYKQETSNVTLLFQVSNSTISHQSSIVLKPYTSYQIQVLVIAKDMGNVPYSSKPVSVRTDEGVPSRSPQNVSVTRLQFNEVVAQWDRLPQQYTHGRLLGYRVYYKESRFPYYNQSQMNITADPQALQVILRDLKAAQTYEISVAAFTSKGEGPRSYRRFITTGCGGYLNKSTGQLHVSGAENSDLHCSWTIGSAGISQAVALVSIQGLNLQYCSEFVKIIDGNGADVFYQQGCSSFGSDTLRYVLFGKANNITVQIFFESRLSFVKLQYAILKQRLLPALPVTDWNLTVTNAAPTSLTVEWEKLIAEVDRSVRSYITFVKSRVGIVLAVEIVPENTTVAVLRGLNPLTQYKVGVVAVDGNGQPYQVAEATSSTTKVSCGYRPSSTRIVGGMIAPVNSWPWQAMLITRSGRQFCGGSLVDPLWVVTAAHCVDRQSASSIRIRLGAHFRTSASLGTEQDIDVARIVQHRNFNVPLLYSNDIAIIKLAKPATLGKGVDLICTPNTNYALPFDNANKKCWITGWGTLSSDGLAPASLRQASLPLVSEQRCLTAYPGKLDDSMFCAGLDEGGVDACQGDSGGPLVCEFNDTWYLEGATSWGEGCADAKKYGVYASIRRFKDWISSNVFDVAPLPTPTFSPAIPSSTFSPAIPSSSTSALGTKSPIPTKTSTTKPSERTPSEEEVRESVTLIVVLDVSMWSKAMEDAFETIIAELATKYCASAQRNCHSTPTSFRKRRSSDNITFSESEVHILPGYPTQTSQDPLQARLAFYLQFPVGESSDVVNRYHLMNIVNSDMSAIEKSLNSPISKVQTLSDDEKEQEEQEDQEEEKSKVNYIVILGSVGGGVFVVCLIAAVLKSKCKKNTGGVAKPRIDAETAVPTSGNAYKNEALEQE